jgi:hypothetical protein
LRYCLVIAFGKFLCFDDHAHARLNATVHLSLLALWATMAAFAGLELACRPVVDGAQRVVDRRRRVAEQLRAGRDTRLSMRVLDTFQITQQLLLEHRKIILGELGVELSAQLKHAAKS